MKFSYNKLAASIVAATAVTASAQVSAQSPQIEEVLVTAQKREQTLQDVPVAVSAFSEDFMKKANVTDVRGLVDFTPGFAGRTEDSFTDALSMRGIVTNDFGIGGDPSVAVFENGIWTGRSGGVQMSFFDVARAEVVKGPQGTLFGRNAIAGAVEVITNKPHGEFEANVDFTVAQFNHLETTATVNVPLSDNLYMRGSVYRLSNDGYLENEAGGDDLGFHDNIAGRVALRYEGETVDATFTYLKEERDQDPSVYFVPGMNSDDRTANIDLLGGEGKDKADIQQLSAHIEIDLSENLSLTSITAHKEYLFDYLEDYDGTPELVNNYEQINDVSYSSQEFRLNFNGDNVQWFIGASVYEEEIDGYFAQIYDEDAMCRAIAATDADDFDFSLGDVTGCDTPAFEDYWGEDIAPGDILSETREASDVDVASSGYAVYGDVTFNITEALDLTLGARYTVDEKEIATTIDENPGALWNHFNYEFYAETPVTNEGQWDALTPRVAVNYQFSDDASIYANASQGYKAGGFATFGFGFPYGVGVTDDGELPPGAYPLDFDPEKVDSIEVGTKLKMLDNSMQFNAAVFAYDYSDLQMSYFDTGSTLVANTGEATGRGVEMDLRYLPSENWDIYLSAAYLKTEITDAVDMIELGACSDCEGNALPFAPELSASAVITYMYPVSSGEFFVTTEAVHQSKMYGGPDNIEAVAVQPWTEVGLRVGFESNNGWDANVFIDNVTNETYFERGWENADIDGTYGYGLYNTLVWPNKPRTIGVRFSFSFD